MTTIVVTHHRFPSHATTLATLTLAQDEQGQQVLSEAGSGSIALPLDDTNDIRINDLLRFSIDGVVRHGIIVERISEHTLDEDGPSRQVRRVDGRGVGAVLEWGVIGPANGFGSLPIERDRLLSWMSVEYDDSWWDGAAFTTNPAVPAEFPGASGGAWIDGPSADPTSAPAGVRYLRDTFTLASATEATAWAAGDNWADVYVDGQFILKTGGPDQSNSYKRSVNARVSLSAGTHTVAARVFNKGPTHSGLRWLLAETSSDGSITDVLHESDDTWKALETPASVPGMTPGEAFLFLLGEVQGRGGLTWLDTDFDAALDSDGVAWPIVADISTRTGNDLLTFATELAGTYVDWAVDPDTLTLSLWIKDTQGGASGVTLEPAAVTDPRTGNLLELDRVRT